jgi:NAD(P)-dependent dehydrogenase (short-subunit alcohol dehydrogenase family)
MGPYREKFGKDPTLIFLENHGVFVSSDDIEEIREAYLDITQKILTRIENQREFEILEIGDEITRFIPAIKSISGARIARMRHSTLHRIFYSSEKAFEKGAAPFTPDIIVYCKSDYIYLKNTERPESIIEEFTQKLRDFKARNNYDPKIVMIKDYGLLALEDTANAAEIALDVYEDLLKISHFSENFGGPRFLPAHEIEFIDNWEVENYRRKISRGSSAESVVNQKICIVTGGAQGFGRGIAGEMVKDGANVVIADINEEEGIKSADETRRMASKNEVLFQKVDVSSPGEIQKLIKCTVEHFGGIDLYLSNAGILHAGSLEEMEPEVFGRMTKINYEAYFLGVKYVSPIMKLQNQYNPSQFSDIIQINSKSGLKGSNKNFAYAGGKFGGLGLTQSFALELAPFRIKVNAVCPGNFFEGPLWAHPEHGLFMQYLKAGKVPGAKSIDEVRKFYEDQVPMKRGCRVEDVVKALYYILSQEYETGQAVPVTGGQIMLS